VTFAAITFVLNLNECLLLFIFVMTQSGNFWIHPRLKVMNVWNSETDKICDSRTYVFIVTTCDICCRRSPGLETELKGLRKSCGVAEEQFGVHHGGVSAPGRGQRWHHLVLRSWHQQVGCTSSIFFSKMWPILNTNCR